MCSTSISRRSSVSLNCNLLYCRVSASFLYLVYRFFFSSIFFFTFHFNPRPFTIILGGYWVDAKYNYDSQSPTSELIFCTLRSPVSLWPSTVTRLVFTWVSSSTRSELYASGLPPITSPTLLSSDPLSSLDLVSVRVVFLVSLHSSINDWPYSYWSQARWKLLLILTSLFLDLLNKLRSDWISLSPGMVWPVSLVSTVAHDDIFYLDTNARTRVSGPLIASKYFFSDGNENSLVSVQYVYLAVACLGASIAALFYFAVLPEISGEELQVKQDAADLSSGKPFWKEWHCTYFLCFLLHIIVSSVLIRWYS